MVEGIISNRNLITLCDGEKLQIAQVTERFVRDRDLRTAFHIQGLQIRQLEDSFLRKRSGAYKL